MKIVETYSGSRYMIDEFNKKFCRLRGKEANSINNDNDEISYLEILFLETGYPMEILWLLNGKEKVRITTPIKTIEEING